MSLAVYGLVALPARSTRTVTRATAPLRAVPHIRGTALTRPVATRQEETPRHARSLSLRVHASGITRRRRFRKRNNDSPDVEGATFTSFAKAGRLIYTVLTASFAISSALFILAPERVLGSVAALPCSAATPLLLRVLGAVQLPAAAATWALTAAVSHHRLGSDTYKRLNLSLIGAAVFTLLGRSVAEPALDLLGVALPTPYFAYCSMITLCIVGPTFMFLENQTQGKLSSVPTTLVAGAVELLPALLKSPNTFSKVYAVLTVLCLASAAALVAYPIESMAAFFTSGLVGASVLDKFVIQAVAGMMLPFAAAVLVLQDAAARGRLSASTFVLLNQTLALKSGVLALVYGAAVWAGQGTGVLGADAACQLALAAFAAHGVAAAFKNK